MVKIYMKTIHYMCVGKETLYVTYWGGWITDEKRLAIDNY